MDVRVAETNQQLQDVFKVRRTVFVEEQGVPEERELDEHDNDSTHFIAYVQNIPVAAGRLRFVDDYGKLERICVLKEFRSREIGRGVISEMEAVIRENNLSKAKLNSQTYVVNFYEELGYEVVSDEFVDAGIPHVTMEKTLS